MSLPADEVLTRPSGERRLFGLALLAVGGLWLLDELGLFHVAGRMLASVALVCIGAGLILTRRTGGRMWPILVGAVLALSLLGNSATSNFRARYGSSIGAQKEAPTAPGQIQGTYRAGLGALTLDLTHVRFPGTWAGTVHVDVGLGAMRITVPQQMLLRVHASDSVGSVRVVGHSVGSGFGVNGTYQDPDWTSDRADPHMTLDLSMAGGAVRVDRASP